MKNRKLWGTMSVIMLVVLGFFIAVQSAAAAAEPVIIKAGHGASESDPVHVSMKRLTEEFEKLTNGRYKTQIFPMGQIGFERDLIEGAQMGSVGLAFSSSGPLASFVSEMGVLEIPFMFKDLAHADRVFMGKIGKELAELFSEKAGVKCFGFWENGSRNLINALRPVNSVEDVAGMKLRTMENEIHMELWKALGASPVPLSGSEAFTALMQGTVDGLENATSNLYNLKYWEAAKHVAMTDHLYSPAVVVMSLDLWESITPEDQQIFLKLFDESCVYNREIGREIAANAIKSLEEVGVQITYPDRNGFIEKTEPLRKKLMEEFGEMATRIINE